MVRGNQRAICLIEANALLGLLFGINMDKHTF